MKYEKTSKTPIIMLSAKTEVFDKVLGLELGADDYMIKPFDSKELVARVKAVLRRYTAAPQPAVSPSEKRVEYKDLIINLSNYEVIYKGKPVEMTPRKSNFCISLLLHQIRYLQENSFLTISGAMNTPVTQEP